LSFEVVAEIGSNWEGDLNKAKKIISECKKAGASAVKFQMWRAKDLYSRNHPEWKIIKKSEVTFEKARKLKEMSDKMGIEFFCSVFYPEAVDFLESIGVKRFKVASRTCLLKDPYALETLERMAQTKKPIIVSMGMGGNKKFIEKLFSKNKSTLFCYCVSEYPLDFKKIDWKLAKEFDGFSDHTMDIVAPILFSTLKKLQGSKKIFIEKHVKSKNSTGPDASTSIDTEHFTNMISHIRIIEKTKI
jgi:sialic acid synthase SpsE